MGWKLYYDAFLKKAAGEDWLKEEAFQFIDSLLDARVSLRPPLSGGPRMSDAGFGAEKYLGDAQPRAHRLSATRSPALHRLLPRGQGQGGRRGGLHQVAAQVRRYGSGGDSAEDEVAADVLDFYYRRGLIEQPVCLFRAGSPLVLNRAFNVFVGKDRTALAKVLTNP